MDVGKDGDEGLSGRDEAVAVDLRLLRAAVTRRQLANRTRDLALFNLAVGSKLRGCDLVRLRVSDIHLDDAVRPRATVCQRKPGRPVPFEIIEPTREALAAWLTARSDAPPLIVDARRAASVSVRPNAPIRLAQSPITRPPSVRPPRGRRARRRT